MDDNKIFCGSGKKIGQYGAIALNLCISDIPAQFIQTGKNGKKYTNLILKALREPKEDRTHYIEVSQYKKE